MVRYSTCTREISAAHHVRKKASRTGSRSRVTTDRYRATESGERTDNANRQIQDRSNPCDGHTNEQTTNGEKFVKSGERTDKANGQIQDRPRFLTGSMVSPPTHPKTNNLRQNDEVESQNPAIRANQGRNCVGWTRAGPCQACFVTAGAVREYEYAMPPSPSPQLTLLLFPSYSYRTVRNTCATNTRPLPGI